MKRVCPKCNFIGIGRHRGSLISGGALLGLGLIFFGLLYRDTTIHNSFAVAIILLVSMFAIGILAIRNFYKTGKECPICKYRKMPSINDPEGQKIIQENNLIVKDTVTDFCTECHNKGLRSRGHSLTGSIIITIFGIIQLILGFFISPIAITGALIILGFGMYGLSTHYRKNNKCPNCKNNTYIPINSPEAKALIEETQA